MNPSKGDISARKDDIMDQRATLQDRKGDVIARKGDAIMPPDPSVSVSSDPALNPSSNTSSVCVYEKTQEQADSDSLRSSGASSLRSNANTQDEIDDDALTKQRVEKAKQRFNQFSKPRTREMMVNIELGKDSRARAEFEEWRKDQEQRQNKTDAAATAA